MNNRRNWSVAGGIVAILLVIGGVALVASSNDDDNSPRETANETPVTTTTTQADERVTTTSPTSVTIRPNVPAPPAGQSTNRNTTATTRPTPVSPAQPNVSVPTTTPEVPPKTTIVYGVPHLCETTYSFGNCQEVGRAVPNSDLQPGDEIKLDCAITGADNPNDPVATWYIWVIVFDNNVFDTEGFVPASSTDIKPDALNALRACPPGP